MSGTGDTIHVLHVDDDPGLTDMVAAFLEREDERIAVQTATNATEAQNILSTDRIDCIISDYEMPGPNGIEFLEGVRESNPDIPFILYTGKGSEEVASDAISAGVSDYLQKESGTEQYELLANEVRKLVEKYRTEQELDTLRRQYTKLVEQNFVGIYIIQHGEFVYVNPRLADIHGYDDPEEVIGMSPLELVAPEERDTVQSNLENRLSGDVQVMQYETVGLTKGGNFIDIELHGSRIELDGSPAIIGAVADVTQQKEERRRLQFLEALEKELTELSIDFLKPENGDFDALLDDALERIGMLVDADRSYVFQIDHETETLSNTHEWCADGIEPQKDMLQSVAVDTFPWLLSQLRDSDSVSIPEVSQLPPEANELQRILNEQGIDSLILAPLKANGTLLGFIGFDWTQAQGSWSGEFIDILQMAGELITMKRQQEVRRQELERYESYLSHSQDIVTLIDENGVIQDQNPAVERVLEFEPENRIGNRVFEYIHPDDRDRVAEGFEEFVGTDTESAARSEFRYEDGNGEYRWLESIGVDQTGTRVGGYVVHSRDVTERKVREQKYRNLFEDSRDALIVFDRDGYLDCNTRTLELFGFDTVDDFLDASPWVLSPPQQPDGRDSETAAMEHIETAFEEGVDFFEWTHQRVDGTEFSAEVKLSRFSYGDETVLLALIRDISDRKERERELKTAWKASQKLIEASPMPIWVQDDEEIFYSNDAAAAFYGYDDPESLIGSAALSFVPEDEREGARKRVEQMLETGEPMNELTGSFLTKNGTTRKAIFAATPIMYYGEQAIVVVANDITERKEREEQLRREKERLDEFAGVVSHDLRNPLNVARGRIELAQEECDTNHLAAAVDGIERSLDLIDDLLALARGGKERGDLEPVAVNELVQACWNTVDTAQGTIAIEVESTIRADRGRLRQLLENLLRNAVQHGGSAVTVSIGPLPDGFYIEDDGSGIPEAVREDVFEPGYSETHDGSGFGLSIVKQIVAAHDWDIRITEGSEGGARFEITGVAFAAE